MNKSTDATKAPLPKDAKQRVGRATAWLLGSGVASLGVIGVLLIWHLSRRARMIRESLGPPKRISLPDPEDLRRSTDAS